MSEVCYLPRQWRALVPEKVAGSVCAVIDVIRATSTIVSALANGADGVHPVVSIAEAEALKALHPAAILAGERDGKPLPGFDLGNSPGDFTSDRVGGKRVILTTTNGTPALAACRGARAILPVCFLNLEAAAARMIELGPPWLIVCAGQEGEFGADDAMVAGALAGLLGLDSPWTSLFRSVEADLTAALRGCEAGREVVEIGLGRDVDFCARRNFFPIVPRLGTDGILR